MLGTKVDDEVYRALGLKLRACRGTVKAFAARLELIIEERSFGLAVLKI